MEKQLREFIAHLDVLAGRLTPPRRPQDAAMPECSQQELKALAALGQRGALIMSDLAAIMKVPLSTATHTIDKLAGKGLVERTRVQKDRRIVRVKFSRKGKRIHQYVLESRFDLGRSMLAALPPKERGIFLQRMKQMSENGQ